MNYANKIGLFLQIRGGERGISLPLFMNGGRKETKCCFILFFFMSSVAS